MPACSAYGCTNRPSTKSKHQQYLEASGLKITFHRIPKNAELRNQWVKAIRRKDWVPSNNSVICSMHFTDDDFDRTSLCVVRLRENAVPSVFKAFPSYLQIPKPLKRKVPVTRIPEVIASTNHAETLSTRSDFPSKCAPNEVAVLSGPKTISRSTSISPESKRKRFESPTIELMRQSFQIRQQVYIRKIKSLQKSKIRDKKKITELKKITRIKIR